MNFISSRDKIFEMGAIFISSYIGRLDVNGNVQFGQVFSNLATQMFHAFASSCCWQMVHSEYNLERITQS